MAASTSTWSWRCRTTRLALVQFVVDEYDALRCEQHLRAQRDFLRAQALERVKGVLRPKVDDDISAMRLRHEDRIHQRVREDFGMRFLADGGQQPLAVGGCRPCPEYEGSHVYLAGSDAMRITRPARSSVVQIEPS